MANSVINQIQSSINSNFKVLSAKAAKFIVNEHIKSYEDESIPAKRVNRKTVENLIFFAWIICSFIFVIATADKLVGWAFGFNGFPVILILLSTIVAYGGFYGSYIFYRDVIDEFNRKHLLR